MAFIYIPDIPQGNQQINQTTNPIEGNFEYIANLVAINHVPFNTVDDFGKHNFISYVMQTNDPSTSSAEMALYSKNVNGDPNIAELFYRYPNNGTVVQLTGQSGSSSGSGSGADGGVSFIPTPITYNANANVSLSTCWQRLSNGILIVQFTVYNGFNTSNQLRPYVVDIPSGVGSNGKVCPSFTQTPFNVHMAPISSAGALNKTNYACTAISKSQINVYYSGSVNLGSTIDSINIIAIGI